MKPQFIAPDYGKHNEDLEVSIRRVKASGAWKKLDTIILIPAAGEIPTKVVSGLLNLYSPPNNSVYKIFAVG